MSSAERTSWQLRYDIAFVRFIAWLVRLTHGGQLSPQTHFYLYDRYWRLAKCHEAWGHPKRAETLKSVALGHWEASGYDEPPPSAALAMPVPRPMTYINVDSQAPRGPGKPAA